MMDLKRWKLFRDIDSSLMSVCKIVKIIDSRTVGFLVLQNDDVYTVTDTTTGRFKFIGKEQNLAGANVCQATKVDALCGKGIINFYGNDFSFAALSEDGCMYSFDSIEDSNHGVHELPSKVLFPDDTIRVHEVSYGAYHTLCLTSEGEIFGWGDDDHGQLGLGSKSADGRDVTKISGFNDSIVQVVAGNETSYALDSLGRVWSWGSCQSSSLGYEASDDQLNPKLIENLPKIKKITAGCAHVLVLSEIGELYFWGRFDPNFSLKTLPTMISWEGTEPLTDIASAVDATYAVCQSKNTVYLLGRWFRERISSPRATEFSSMEEVFACAELPIMLQPISVKVQPQRVVDAWKRAFNDHSTADVVFSVENEVLHAHSVFLKLQSDYFRNMFDNGWRESTRESRVIKIEGFSFRTFNAFVYFLYNESLIESDMSVDDLLELMKAADYYVDGDLRSACENKLKTKLTPENACLVYACAVKSNAESLQNDAVEFMVPVYKEVVNSVECVKMDSDLKTKLMIHFANLNVFQVSKKRRIL